MGARSSRPIYIFPADVANATFSRFDTSPGELAVDVAQKYSRGFGWRPDVKFFRVDAKDSDRIVRARDLKDFVADDKLMSPSLPIPRGTWLIAIGKPLALTGAGSAEGVSGSAGGAAVGFAEILTAIQAVDGKVEAVKGDVRELQRKQEASFVAAERARLSRLIVRPGPPSGSSRARLDEETARMDLKIRVLRYYGLLADDSNPDKGKWTAFTMLHAPGAPPLQLKHCTLAHIWPSELAHFASDIASELKLPDGFYDDPRNYLVLPYAAHFGYDTESLIFVPKRNGKIVVRKWRWMTRNPDDWAKMECYVDRELAWPNSESASPHLPFMRLIAYRMMSAVNEPLRDQPDVDTSSERAWAVDASMSAEGNAAARASRSYGAYINADGASFADSFIMLPDLVIFLHDKQDITTRKARFDSVGQPPSICKQKHLELEFSKLEVKRSCQAIGPYGFLLVTDKDGEPMRQDLLEKGILLAPHDDHVRLLGRMCVHLLENISLNS